jgi:hypothetical protein
MQSPVLSEGMIGNRSAHQGRSSAGRMPSSYPSSMAQGCAIPNGQQGGFMNDSRAIRSMQQSALNRGVPGNNAHQRRMSNSNMAPHALTPMINGRGMPNSQPSQAANGPVRNPLIQNSARKQPINGVGGSSVAPSRASSPVVESAVANCRHQEPSNNGKVTRPTAPKTPPKNSKFVQVIKLTRSGGTIGPTTISEDTERSHNTKARARPNGRTGSPEKATIAQRRGSNGQDTMRIASMPSRNPQMLNNTNVGLHPRGCRPPAPAEANIKRLGISNYQEIARVANAKPPTSAFGPPLPKGAPTPTLPKQTKAPNSSNPPGPLPTPVTSSSSTPVHGPSPFPRPSAPPKSATMNAASSFPPFLTSTTSNLAESNSHRHPNGSVLHHAYTNPLPSSGIMGPPPRPTLRRSASQPEGLQAMLFKPLIFCRGCPWRQIDVRKARICEDCKGEKLAILSHKHMKFSPLHDSRGMNLDEGEGVGWGKQADTQRQTCMICPAWAASKCNDCPLKLCSGCQVMLQKMCKLTTLVSYTVEMFADNGPW